MTLRVAADASEDQAPESDVVVRELRSRPIVAFAFEVALILFAVFVYFGVRGLTEGRVDKAFANTDALLRIEEALGIAWELRIQAAILGHQTLIAAANWVYVYGHWPVIAVGAVFLYAHRRDKYRLLRDAMIISGLIGFVFFAAFPVAPPRLAEPGVVDTVTEYSKGYRALQPPRLTNQYAAMPSLHFGWNLLLGFILYQASTHIALRVLAVVMPVAMALAVVATANHFVLDVVVGAVVVLLALAVATYLRTRTLGEGERPMRTNERMGGSPLRSRAQIGELAEHPAERRDAGHPDDRGRRPPLPRTARGASSEDARPDSDPLGPLEARQPVRAPTRRL